MKYLNHFKFFIHSGCNAATCDPQVGYCHLGYYKGLDNVSLTHQNLSKDEKEDYKTPRIPKRKREEEQNVSTASKLARFAISK